jgi:hypothetical protein
MIDENIAGNTPSAITNPTDTVSDAVVSGDFIGSVILEAKAPNGDWKPVYSGSGAYSVSTPDPAIEYRFRPVNVTGSAHVYLGP